MLQMISEQWSIEFGFMQADHSPEVEKYYVFHADDEYSSEAAT